MFYGLMILFAMTIISVLNIVFGCGAQVYEWWKIILIVIAEVVIVIAIDGLFATVVRWFLPKKWFGVNNDRFCASKKERKILEKLGIKKWKDKVIELGFFTSFRKNKISDPKSKEYVERYILEANYGTLVHLSGMIFGFLVILICPPSLRLTVGLPVGIVNLFVNWLSFAILRYNLPKLFALYKFNMARIKKEEREKVNPNDGIDGTTESAE